MEDKQTLPYMYAKRFWAFADGVAGFAVAQGLTFLLAVGPHTSDLAMAVASQKPLAMMVSIVCGFGYVGLLAYFESAYWNLIGSDIRMPLRGYLKAWSILRLIAVITSVLLCLPVIATATVDAPANCASQSISPKGASALRDEKPSDPNLVREVIR